VLVCSYNDLFKFIKVLDRMANNNVVNFELTQGLRNAFGSVTMPFANRERCYVMTKKSTATAATPFPDKPEEFLALWTEGAARAAILEREKAADKGLDVPGTLKGRLAVRKPTGKIVCVKNFDKS
jgi:hypothetical protein